MAPSAQLPPFPRPVSSFVGRGDDIRRALELLDRETLLMVYGVGGVGKSELVYKVIERARELDRWRDATPVLLEVQPHFGIDRVLATLSARVGAAGGPDEIAEIARALDASPHLVFVDDAHHIDPSSAARLFGYLSRHVRASRIFAASRLEVPLPPDAPPPVVTRLGALDEAATGEMVSLLAQRLGIETPDAGAVFERSKGSPFFIQRELAAAGHGAGRGEDALEQSLRALSPDARRLLALATVMRGRLGVDDLRGATEPAAFDARLAELVRRFLIDVDRDVVIVHGLVRDAVYRVAADDELQDAKRTVASLLLARGSPLDVVEAVHQRVMAGDDAAAWELIEQRYRTVAAAGLDHLLLEDLRGLAAALPERWTAVELLTARILVRRSLIDEAQQVVDRIGSDDAARGSYRYLFLAAEVAQRIGRLDEAGELFRRAREASDAPAERFLAGIQLATTFAVRGHGGAAREVLDAIWPELSDPSPRHRGRWAWGYALSHALEEGHVQTYEATSPAIRELRDSGLDDLVVRLELLEVAARVENDEIERGRHLLEHVLGRASLRERVAALYQGVVLYGAGDLRGARVALDGAFEYFTRHSDTVYAGIAARFLGLVMLYAGDLSTAIEVTLRNERASLEGNLDSLYARAIADHAVILLAAGDAATAGKRAREALALPHTGVHTRVRARYTLAAVRALVGDREGCRAELALARSAVAGDGSRARQREIDLVEAELALMLGDVRAAIERAEPVRVYYQACGRAYAEARANLALAAGYAARAGEADLVMADELVARSEQLSASRGYRGLLAKCALIRAALLARRGDAGRAREMLTGTVRDLGALAQGFDGALLRAALQADPEMPVAPGVRAAVSALGLLDAARFAIVNHRGRHAATDAQVERQREQCDLVVEVDRGVIVGNRGAATVRGRPITCKLLAALIEAQPGVVTAEQLYLNVWGAAEYHPLRHRNTVYVALNRLRRTLSEMYPGRQLIERVPDGWRLDGSLSVCAIETTTHRTIGE